MLFYVMEMYVRISYHMARKRKFSQWTNIHEH